MTMAMSLVMPLAITLAMPLAIPLAMPLSILRYSPKARARGLYSEGHLQMMVLIYLHLRNRWWANAKAF